MTNILSLIIPSDGSSWFLGVFSSLLFWMHQKRPEERVTITLVLHMDQYGDHDRLHHYDSVATLPSLLTEDNTLAIPKATIQMVTEAAEFVIPRQRRPRIAIELPPDADLKRLDRSQVKKIKNRIAAARARSRAQQRVENLERQLREAHHRILHLEQTIRSIQPNNSAITNPLYFPCARPPEQQPFGSRDPNELLLPPPPLTGDAPDLAELVFLFPDETADEAMD